MAVPVPLDRHADAVVADFKGYYLMKRAGVPVYLPTYLDVMSQYEKQSVTTLWIRPEDASRAFRVLGGE
ncbi:hypothetical protein, partial [Staphylococcus aureus]